MLVDRLKSLLNVGKPEPSDRRGAPRSRVLLKADVLPVVSYANMSIVNVSRTGFAGETMTPLRATDLLIFSIVGNRFHQGSVRWVRGPKFGIDLVDALDILSCSDAVDPGFLASHASRSKRYPVDLTGRIAIGSICYHSTVRDVSRSGMRLEIDAVLEVGQQVIVRLPDRPLILASVRWAASDMAGIETADQIQTLRLVCAGVL